MAKSDHTDFANFDANAGGTSPVQWLLQCNTYMSWCTLQQYCLQFTEKYSEVCTHSLLLYAVFSVCTDQQCFQGMLVHCLMCRWPTSRVYTAKPPQPHEYDHNRADRQPRHCTAVCNAHWQWHWSQLANLCMLCTCKFNCKSCLATI